MSLLNVTSRRKRTQSTQLLPLLEATACGTHVFIYTLAQPAQIATEVSLIFQNSPTAIPCPALMSGFFPLQRHRPEGHLALHAHRDGGACGPRVHQMLRCGLLP